PGRRGGVPGPSPCTGPLCVPDIVVRLTHASTRARSSTDRASDYGSEGWGFESLRAHNVSTHARPGGRSSSPAPASSTYREERRGVAEVVIVPDSSAAGELVAAAIARRIEENPEFVLGLATGSSPLPVYRRLASHLEGVDVSRVRCFALDEYVGIDPDHPERYHNVLHREVVEPLGLDPERV